MKFIGEGFLAGVVILMSAMAVAEVSDPRGGGFRFAERLEDFNTTAVVQAEVTWVTPPAPVDQAEIQSFGIKVVKGFHGPLQTGTSLSLAYRLPIHGGGMSGTAGEVRPLDGRRVWGYEFFPKVGEQALLALKGIYSKRIWFQGETRTLGSWEFHPQMGMGEVIFPESLTGRRGQEALAALPTLLAWETLKLTGERATLLEKAKTVFPDRTQPYLVRHTALVWLADAVKAETPEALKIFVSAFEGEDRRMHATALRYVNVIIADPDFKKIKTAPAIVAVLSQALKAYQQTHKGQRGFRRLGLTARYYEALIAGHPLTSEEYDIPFPNQEYYAEPNHIFGD